MTKMGKFSYLRWAALALLWLHGSAGQAQCPPCSALSAAISSYPYCNVVNATLCPSVRCSVDSLTTTLSIDQCTDPLEISVQVNSESFFFSYTFINSSAVTVNGTTVNFTTSRTASSVSLQVALINGSVLVPPLIIGLNETACMCQSMQALASSVDPPAPASGSCQRASTCSGVDCILTVPFVETFDVEVDFEVCQEPPRMLVVVEDSSDSVLLDQYFNTSETVDVSVNDFLSFTLDVVIENYDYSMIIQVTMSALGMTGQFFPKQQIILDKSGCGNAPTTAPPTTPANQPISVETCSAVTNLSISSALALLGGSCEATQCCDSVVCAVADYSFYIQLLPCNEPSAVFLQGSNTSGILFEANLEMMLTAVFSVSDLGSLEFFVSGTDDYIRVQVNISSSSLGTIEIIPLQNIPINRCLCPDVACPETSPPLTASSPASVTLMSSTSTESDASVSISPTIEQTGLDSAVVAAIVVPVVLVVAVLVILVVVGALITVLRHGSSTKSSSPAEPVTITKLDSLAEPL